MARRDDRQSMIWEDGASLSRRFLFNERPEAAISGRPTDEILRRGRVSILTLHFTAAGRWYFRYITLGLIGNDQLIISFRRPLLYFRFVGDILLIIIACSVRIFMP